jgi:AraC family transcriptional regulator
MTRRFATAACATALAVVALWGCKKKETVEVQEPKPPPIETFPIEEVDEFNYVCVEMEGGYDKHGVAISQLVMAIKDQGIETKGPMFGVYYNSPEDVPPDLLKWEVGFAAVVDPAAKLEDPLVVKTWTYTWVASTVYTGPYQGTAETYKRIFKFIDSRDDYEPAGPTMERFLDENPDLVEPDDLKTEIWVPVQEPPPPEPEATEEGGEATEEDDEATSEEGEAAEPEEVIEPEEPAPKKGKKGK